ncbi:MAG: RagB/SusD family nutrient uptake outer membrane protein [Bacteroidales bacterium]
MKYRKILSIALLSFALSGCEDFLTVDSPSSFDASYVFTNAADAEKMIMGVYSLFAQDTYTSRMSNTWMQNTDVEVMAPGASPDGSRRDIWSLQGGLLTNFGDIYKCWQDNYLAIDRANQCIEGILKSDVVNTQDMQNLLGEAYCLRAYRYFLLCNFWGDVPYFREAAKAGMELDIPKTDKHFIYSGMIQDLINCEGQMYFADQMTAGIERMNREFALGFIARLSLFRAGYGMTKEGVMKRAEDYLDMNDPGLAVTYTLDGVTKTARTSDEYYQLAKDYCLRLIALKGRELNPDFGQIFKNQCTWTKPVNDEMLFEIGFGNVNGGGDVGWCVGTTVTSSSKGSTTIQVGLAANYYYLFDPRDKRLPVTISAIEYTSDTNQKPVGPVSLGSGKWNRLWLTSNPGSLSSKGTGINWPILRYSDILLMLAEAENQLNGPSDLACGMLAKVRSRAFDAAYHDEMVSQYIASLADKQSFFEAIVKERALEFGGECMRKFDLIRWNNYGKKIIEAKQFLNNVGKAANDLDLENPEVAPFANYARRLYYQRKDGTVIFMNTHYNPEIIPEETVGDEELEKYPDKYAYINWSSALYKKITDKVTGIVTYEPSDFTVRSWRGYTDPTGVAAVPYLLPISSQTVATSIYLNNDGYGHQLTTN